MKTVSGKRGAILVVLSFSVAALAQSAPEASSARPSPIAVSFFALDRKGQPVADVRQSDLTVLDNKQPIGSITALKKGAELPLRLGLLVDASNSERGSGLYEPEVQAGFDLLYEFLNHPEDKVFVVKATIVPEASEFMDRTQLPSYKVNLTPAGATALYDAVGFACDSRMKKDDTHPARRVLVLLSDGDDNQSHITRDEAIAKALDAGVVIFVVSTSDDSRGLGGGGSGNSSLQQFAEKTGGEAFLHLGRKDIDKVFSAIRAEIDNMYTVSFDVGKEGRKGFHSIELKLPQNDKSRLRTPKGFYVR